MNINHFLRLLEHKVMCKCVQQLCLSMTNQAKELEYKF